MVNMRIICIAPSLLRKILPLLAIGCCTIPAFAEDPSYSGDLWSRSTFTGDWGGGRDDLAKKGITVDARLTQFYQGEVSGYAEGKSRYGAKGDLIVTLDGEKLGFWRGFSTNVHQEWNFGGYPISFDDGTFIPANYALAFPRIGGSSQDTAIVVSQKFGERLTISAGKFNLADIGSKVPIKGGGGLDTFWNTALALPFTGYTPPYIFGMISNLNVDWATFTFMVHDPRNAQSWDVISTAFSQGTTVNLGVTVPVQPFGLPGSIGVKGAYSTKEGLDLSKIPELIQLPPESQEELTKRGGWMVTINGNQYFWQNPLDPAIGWGVFGELAVTDENPNPLRGHFLVGIGGTSRLLGNGLDRWGVGFFRYGLSNDLKNGLRALSIVREDEQGLEAFYNVAITPWLRVSFDLQWVDPTTPDRKDVVLAGMSLQTRF